MRTDQEEKRLARYLSCTHQHNEKLLWYWNRIIVTVSMQVPCFFAVRVMVSLKVLQLELSPPHTPHLSSCFEEPTTPSQPTFCSWRHGKFSTCGSGEARSHRTLSYIHTHTQTQDHSPCTPHARTHCEGPCMSSACHPGPLSAWRPHPVSLWTGNAGCSVW